MKSGIYSKKLGIGGILSEAWRLFKANFWLISLIIFIVYIPINMVLVFVPAESLVQDIRNVIAFYRLVKILEGLIGIIATMAIIYLVKMRVDGKRIDAWTALKEALFKWPAAVLTSIVAGISVLFMFLLLIVPGVIFSIYWMFVIYAVILKGEMAFGAMSYSKSVVKGRWWKTFGYTFVFGILTAVVALVLGGLLGIILAIFPEGVIGTGVDVVLSTCLDVVLAYFSVVWAVFFINFDATKKK